MRHSFQDIRGTYDRTADIKYWQVCVCTEIDCKEWWTVKMVKVACPTFERHSAGMDRSKLERWLSNYCINIWHWQRDQGLGGHACGPDVGLPGFYPADGRHQWLGIHCCSEQTLDQLGWCSFHMQGYWHHQIGQIMLQQKVRMACQSGAVWGKLPSGDIWQNGQLSQHDVELCVCL